MTTIIYLWTSLAWLCLWGTNVSMAQDMLLKLFKPAFVKAEVTNGNPHGRLMVSSYVLDLDDDQRELEHTVTIEAKKNAKEFGTMNYLSLEQVAYLQSYPRTRVEVEVYYEGPQLSDYSFARAEVKGAKALKIYLFRNNAKWELALRPITCPCPDDFKDKIIPEEKAPDQLENLKVKG